MFHPHHLPHLNHCVTMALLIFHTQIAVKMEEEDHSAVLMALQTNFAALGHMLILHAQHLPQQQPKDMFHPHHLLHLSHCVTMVLLIFHILIAVKMEEEDHSAVQTVHQMNIVALDLM